MRVIAFLFMLTVCGSALASNPDRMNPTLLPSTGIRFDRGHNEDRFTASLNRLFFRGPLGPLRLGLSLSAALQEKHQNVPFLDPGFTPMGFTGKLLVAWDTLYWTRYAVRVPPLLRQRLCPLVRKTQRACDAKAIERWLSRNKRQLQAWREAKRGEAKARLRWRKQQQALQKRWFRYQKLSTGVLLVPYSRRIHKICQPTLAGSKNPAISKLAKWSENTKQSARRACLYLLKKTMVAGQKAAALHRLRGMTRLQQRRADATLYSAIETFQGGLMTRQRELSRRLPPVLPKGYPHSFHYSIGLEMFGGLRRLSAFPSQTATAAEEINSYHFQVGPALSLYFSPRWSFHLRAGLSIGLPVSLKDGKRCKGGGNTAPGGTADNKLPGGPGNVNPPGGGSGGGESCEKVQFVEKTPVQETRFYVRTGVTALFDLNCCSTTFGVELRASLEKAAFESNLGKDLLVEVQLLFFTVSKVSSLLGRFHFGVHLGLPLGENNFQKNETGFFFLPFVGFGQGL